MSSSYELHLVDRFIVGTIGMPGDRTFYFQVAVGRQVLSFRCEKGQVGALVDALERLLRDLPASSPAGMGPWSGLELPLLEEWPIGVIGLAYDGDGDRIIVVLEELQRSESAEAGKAQFGIHRSHAAAMIDHGRQILASGRPLCPFCGTSIDPDGFNCSCNN